MSRDDRHEARERQAQAYRARMMVKQAAMYLAQCGFGENDLRAVMYEAGRISVSQAVGYIERYDRCEAVPVYDAADEAAQ